MPRKTSPWMPTRSGSMSFNEAAARCRGKLARRLLTQPPGIPASMRPRPDAAENQPDENPEQPDEKPASMRPRPDAAENSFPAVVQSGSDGELQ